MARNFICASAIAATFALSAPASAQETVLTLSSWLPPSHPIVEGMMVPWAAAVEEATEGRVVVQILDSPLGPPPAHFDLARDGVADITYGVHGYTPGRFTLHEIVELPFLSPNATAISVAYWRLFESTLAEFDEHEGVHVLGVFAHGPGMVWTTGASVYPIEGLEGAKIRVAGSIAAQLAEQMGLVAVQAPAPQSFELLNGGVADGIFFPGESITFFRLDSLITQGLRVDGGFYNVSFFFVMNEDVYAGLSEEDRAAIDAVSGEAFARIAGAAWDAADAAGIAALEGKVEIFEATEDDMAGLTVMVEPIYAGVRAKYEGAGLDFDAILTAVQADVEAVAAE